MANVKFKSGAINALPQSIDNGTLFATTDSKELYIDIEDQRIALPNKDTINNAIAEKSSVSVSSSGTSTTEAKYITVNNTEYKIGGGITYEEHSLHPETWVITSDTSLYSSMCGNGTFYSSMPFASYACGYLGFIGINNRFQFSTDGATPETTVLRLIGTNWSWENEGYKTLVFEDTPTGTLLTWLQTYATKQ